MPDRSTNPQNNDNRSPLEPILLQLPPDLRDAIAQRAVQTGQEPSQVILQVLRSSLLEAEPAFATIKDLKKVAARLLKLEALVGRVDELEGKSIAF